MICKIEYDLTIVNFGSLGFHFFLSGLGSGGARLTGLRRLLLVDISALVLALVAAVVVPATLAAIVVVSQDERVNSRGIALGILDIRHPVELFANGSLNDHVLLILVVLGRSLEVKLVIISVRNYHLSLFHVHADRKNSLQREVWVLDVAAVHLLVLVEQIGVLELLDWLLCDL